MILRPPSLSKDWDAYWSGDPAFTQPPPLSTPPTDEERKARDEYIAKLKAARDTGDYSALLIPGQTPTKFVMRQVDRNVFRELVDRCQLPDSSPRHIGANTALALLFRLAVKTIVGWDEKIKHAPDPDWDDWSMAPGSVVAALDEVDPGIVTEIGDEVHRRLREGISGKS